MENSAIMEISLMINGVWMSIDIHPDETLVNVLREKLRMTGTKVSCGQGECGVCTVLLDGEAVNSCLILAASVDGRRVTTIEGLSDATNLDPIQQAFVDQDASQCGFCTPGMIMSTKGLLRKKSTPSTEEIKTALAGNICRCTGYNQIIHAVKIASENKTEKALQDEKN
jgi:aerobic-type carbon monoxide dehydrogenase small subunit (CoxS/CutS family)